jgi:hypothetical protein
VNQGRAKAVGTFALTQKYQKVKTGTEIALEAGLPCGDGNFRKGRRIRKEGTDTLSCKVEQKITLVVFLSCLSRQEIERI